MSAQLSGILHWLGSAGAWLAAQLKITVSDLRNIAAALVHIHLTWLIHPVVTVAVIWVLFKIIKMR